jgi:hypothetical protein
MKAMTMALSKGAGSVALKLTIVSAAALGGAGMVATNVFAALTATATNTSGGQVTTGTLKLTLASGAGSGGFTTPISSMAPGDSVSRFVNLVNGGNLDGLNPSLLITTSDTNTLVESTTAGLQILITGCSIAWSGGICNESQTAVLGPISVKTLKTTEQTITLGSLLAGSTNYLKITTSLSTSTENILNGFIPESSIQGKTATLTWNFTIQQRTAVSSSS